MIHVLFGEKNRPIFRDEILAVCFAATEQQGKHGGSSPTTPGGSMGGGDVSPTPKDGTNRILSFVFFAENTHTNTQKGSRVKIDINK